MTRIQERLIPLAEGPPRFDERQVTPEQLLDMRLGYLSSLGAEVELVSTETEQAMPVTILAVGRTFGIGKRPEESRLVTPDEIDTSPMWTDCDYVAFYTTSQNGGVTKYNYDHLSYSDLGLAPVRDDSYSPVGWHPKPIWHLRWPAEGRASQSTVSP